MKIPALFALTVCLAAASPAASQLRVPRIEPGTRVRVSVPARNNGQVVQGTDRWVTGTLLSMDSSQLSLRVDGRGEDAEYTVPFNVLDRLEVSHGELGRQNAERKGLVQGTIIGTGFAESLLVFGLLVGGPIRDEDEADCTAECEVIGMSKERVVRNGLIGAATGALLGYAFAGQSKEVWERLDIPRLTLSIGRSSLALRLPLGN